MRRVYPSTDPGRRSRRPLSPKHPAVRVWQHLVVCCCIFTCLLETFMASFNSTYTLLWVLAYLCDAVYLVEIFLSFVLPYVDNSGIIVTERGRIIRRYIMSTFLLDLLSVLPTDILAYALPAISSWKLLTWVRMNRLVRFYKVLYFFDKRDEELGTNTFILRIFKYGVICISATHWATCSWFALSCVGFHKNIDNTCFNNTWGKSFDFGFDIEETDTFRAYIVSLYWAVATVTSTGYGDLTAVTNNEQWVSIFIMLIGIAVYFGMLLGGMTSILTNVDRKRAQYVHRFNTIKDNMKDLHVPEDLQMQVIGYYEYVWHRQKGVKLEGIYDGLPLALQAEISHTASHSILQKAPLFKGMEAGFMRMLSLSIKTLFFLPQQIIITRGDIGQHMYFIRQGEVEVLSEEDDETPVATLRSGMLFGELSLLFSLPRTATVRAATHCDLMALDKHDLNNILIHYPNVIHRLQAEARRRCKTAEDILLKSDKEINPHFEALRSRKSSVVMRSHSKHHAFSAVPEGSFGSLHTKERRTSVFVTESLEIIQSDLEKDNSLHDFIVEHTSSPSAVTPGKGDHKGQRPVRGGPPTNTKILRMLVELGRWLKNTTLHPHSPLVRFWERFILAVILLVAIIYPYMACFTAYDARSGYNDSDVGKVLLVLTYILDFFLMLDIVVTMRTEILTPYGTLSDFQDIVKNYCCRWYFGCDILAVLPLEICCLVEPLRVQHWQLLAFLRLNRLIKFIRVPQYFSRMERYLDVSVTLIRTMKVLMYILLLSHWTACVLYTVACYGPECKSGSWIRQWAKVSGDPGYNTTAPSTEYITSLYWAVATMTSTGYGDISAHTTLGRLFSLSAMLIGLLLYGYCLSSMAATLANEDSARVRFQEKLFAVKDFMKERQLEISLRERVIHYLSRLWEKYRGEWLPGHETLMHDVPVALQQDICEGDICKALAKVPLFKETESSFLRVLALKAQLYIFSPGDVIVYAGDMGREMYCIRRGICKIIAPDKKMVLAEIGPGHYFGEVGMIFGAYRTATVQAKTHVEALMLRKSDIDNILEDFPLIKAQFNLVQKDKERLQRLQDHIARCLDTVTCQSESHCSIDDTQNDQRNVKTGHLQKLFRRRNLNDSLQRFEKNMDEDTKKEYMTPFKGLHPLLKIFAHMLMNMTFKPTGGLLKIWTLVMLMVAFISCFTLPLQAAFLHTSVTLWIFNYVLDIISYLNIYIGFHIAFYNEKNVLVTHPLSTARNYLQTNFLIDILTCFPFELFAYAAYPHFTSNGFHLFALVRLNRLLQAYRLPLAFSYLEYSVERKTGNIRQAKFGFYVVIFMHWVTSILFIMACPPSLSDSAADLIPTKTSHRCIAGSWIHKVTCINLSDVNLETLYIVSLYWASATTVSVGYGDITAATDTEMVVAAICMILGVVFFGYIIASVAASLANADAQRARFQEKLSNIESFSENQKLDDSLKKRVRAHYDYIWMRTRGVDPKSLFDGLPFSLWGDVTCCLYEEFITKIFKDTEIGFIKMLSKCIKPMLFLQGEYVMRKYDIGSEMYFVYRGAVDVVSMDGTQIFDTLNAGASCGEVALLFSCPRIASVRARVNTDIFCLSKQDLDQVLELYPNIKDQVLQIAEVRRQEARRRSEIRTVGRRSSIRSVNRLSGPLTMTGSIGELLKDNQDSTEPGKSIPQISVLQHPVLVEQVDQQKVERISIVEEESSIAGDSLASLQKDKALTETTELARESSILISRSTESQELSTVIDQADDELENDGQIAPFLQQIGEARANDAESRDDPSKENFNQNNLGERESPDCVKGNTVIYFGQLAQRIQTWNRFTISPNSHQMKTFRSVACFLGFISTWLLVYQAAFQDHHVATFALNYMLDIFFIVQIFINFHLSFFDDYGDLVENYDAVCKNYLKSGNGFWLDLTAAMPLDFFTFLVPRQHQLAGLSYLRLIHMLRLVRVAQFFDALEKELSINMLMVRLCKFLAALTLFIHVCSSIWYCIACPMAKCQAGSWADKAGVKGWLKGYCASIYWCVATLTSTGYGDIRAHTPPEMVFASVVMVTGKLMLGFILANIASTLANEEAQQIVYIDKLTAVKNAMNDQSVPAGLQQRVTDYLTYVWMRNKGKDSMGLFRDASECMVAEICMAITSDMLNSIPLVKDMKASFKRTLCQKVTQVLFMPGDYILHKGDLSKELCYVHRGKVDILEDDDGAIIDTLTPGKIFGESSLLHSEPCKVAVRAQTHVDLLCLSPSDLEEVLAYYPAEMAIIQRRAKEEIPDTIKPLADVMTLATCPCSF